MAERVGFEPTVPLSITGFQDQLLKPLGHLSKKGWHVTMTKLHALKVSCIINGASTQNRTENKRLQVSRFTVKLWKQRGDAAKHPISCGVQ